MVVNDRGNVCSGGCCSPQKRKVGDFFLDSCARTNEASNEEPQETPTTLNHSEEFFSFLILI